MKAARKGSFLNAFAPYVQSHAGFEGARVRAQLASITISRQTGSGAISVAQMVAERLNEGAKGADWCPWTVFDRDLGEKILQDHNLPMSLKQFMKEEAKFPVTDAVEQLLGLHPLQWTLVEHTTDTILRLARLGHAILVGRGSSFIASKLKNVLHVRLVAPLEERLRHSQKYYEVQPGNVADFVQKSDVARRRYVRRYFDAEIDDPLGYHLTINTGRVAFDEAALMIAEAATRLEARLAS